MSAAKIKKSGRAVVTVTCEKCGHEGPLVGILGNVCGNKNCHHCGTHIGECFKCGFTLVSDRDGKCPRCFGKLTKCACGVSIKAGEKKCDSCKKKSRKVA